MIGAESKQDIEAAIMSRWMRAAEGRFLPEDVRAIVREVLEKSEARWIESYKRLQMQIEILERELQDSEAPV